VAESRSTDACVGAGRSGVHRVTPRPPGGRKRCARATVGSDVSAPCRAMG